VIPFKILDADAMLEEELKPFKDREIFRKRKRPLPRRNFLKTEEELKEVAQNHQMAHTFPFQIQESEKGLHFLAIPSGKMGV